MLMLLRAVRMLHVFLVVLAACAVVPLAPTMLSVLIWSSRSRRDYVHRSSGTLNQSERQSINQNMLKDLGKLGLTIRKFVHWFPSLDIAPAQLSASMRGLTRHLHFVTRSFMTIHKHHGHTRTGAWLRIHTFQRFEQWWAGCCVRASGLWI